jgi:dihydrofolate reductase
MRKITYGGAASLDGYFARKNDAMDWLLWSDELRAIMSEYWGTIDTVLMGRRTYEVSRQMGGGQRGKMRTYVFSRTLPPDGSATIVNGDAIDFVRNLKHE